jgi:hypothetical protein
MAAISPSHRAPFCPNVQADMVGQQRIVDPGLFSFCVTVNGLMVDPGQILGVADA